jgi:hypothetical protein
MEEREYVTKKYRESSSYEEHFYIISEDILFFFCLVYASDGLN